MSAQPQVNQERVKTWLENAGLEYTVDSAGIISVNFAVCTVVIGLQHDNFIWVRAVWKANLTRTDAALLQTYVNELNASVSCRSWAFTGATPTPRCCGRQ